MAAEIPIVSVARASALRDYTESRGTVEEKKTCVFHLNGRHRAIEHTMECRQVVAVIAEPGNYLYTGIARAAENNFFLARNTRRQSRARACTAASSFSMFLIVIYNWTRERGGTFRDR